MKLNNNHLILIIISFLSISISLTVLMLPHIDKSSIDTALYVVNMVPFIYWISVCTLVFTLILGLARKNVALCILLLILSIAYVELPRLMYENGFQIEYFHQAQIFHVLNYGTVTDPKYPFPVADVAHAIFSSAFIYATGLEANYAISHLLPILLRIVLTISTLSIIACLRNSKYYLFFLIIASLYVIISDTEPSFANHYIFVLPLYGMLIYLLVILDCEENAKMYVPLLLITSTIIFSHIYFATLIIISLLTYLFFNKMIKNRTHLYERWILLLAIIFFIWHGYACTWSIEKFYAEINYALLPAIDRFLSFEMNPFIYFFKAKERYGSISIKIYYANMLLLKNIIVITTNLVVLLILIYNVFYLLRLRRFSEILKVLLAKRTVHLWSLSAILLVIYGLTGTAHPQRVLEAFIIPNFGTILIFQEYLERKISIFQWKNKRAEIRFEENRSLLPSLTILVATLICILFIPLKIATHWSTSLTYIGFSQKYLHQASFMAKFGNHRMHIHYVGPTPYWFLTEITSRWPRSFVYDLNGPEGETYFTETLTNIKCSLNATDGHYIYYSLSSLFAMRAKYFIEPSLDNFTKNYEKLLSKASLIYIDSLTENIIYVPASAISLQTRKF